MRIYEKGFLTTFGRLLNAADFFPVKNLSEMFEKEIKEYIDKEKEVRYKIDIDDFCLEKVIDKETALVEREGASNSSLQASSIKQALCGVLATTFIDEPSIYIRAGVYVENTEKSNKPLWDIDLISI